MLSLQTCYEDRLILVENFYSGEYGVCLLTSGQSTVSMLA